MSAPTRTRKEFALSDEVPEAVLETELARATAAWKVRSDSAAAGVAFPAAPYRIRGDSEAQAWFVEEAMITRSYEPSPDVGYASVEYLMVMEYRMGIRGGKEMREVLARRTRATIAALDADRPTAELEWRGIGRKRKGFFTYARAAAWLREYLAPVRDESTYFRKDGAEA